MSQTKTQLVEGLNINTSAPADALVIDNSGRVGVGTSNPASILAIQASGTQTSLLSARANGGSGGGMVLQTDASDDGLFRLYDSAGDIQVQLDTDGGDNYIAKGNVGIGTTSPAELLHIVNPSSTANVRISGGSTGGTYSNLSFYGGTTKNAEIYANSSFFGLTASNSNPIRFDTGGSESARIDSSGRLLVGTTTAPGTIGTSAHVVIKGNSTTANGYLGLIRNAANPAADTGLGHIEFGDANGARGAGIQAVADGAWATNDYPGRLVFSTTADNAAAPTERMRISANGNVAFDTNTLFVDAVNNRVGIGTTNPQTEFEINTPGPIIRLVDTDSPGAVGFYGVDPNGTFVRTFNTDVFRIMRASGNETLRADGSGRLLVGTQGDSNAPADCKFVVNQSEDVRFLTAGFGLKLIRSNVPGNGGSLGRLLFVARDSGSNEVLGANIQAAADAAAWSSGNAPTRLIFATASAGSTDLTERMRIKSTGRVTIPDTGGFVSVIGHTFDNNGSAQHVTDNDYCMLLNRRGSDGDLVQFRQADAQEGTISVNGGTVSYNGAHLSRWSQLPGGAERTEILRGSVLSNIDEMCEWSYEAQPAVLWEEGDGMPEGVSVGDVRIPAKEAGTESNEQLNRMKVSDVEGDRNVSGVFQSWDDNDDTYTNDFYCAMTGDFVIRIAQGVTVQRGDLLMSAGDGTAKPQDDDIIRSKTIAKVTSTHVSETYADGSYCVPCVLMAC